MSRREDLVRDVLFAADGPIVGRVRIQKVFYLLNQLGLEGDFRFSYHHYGPYSEDLSQAIDRAHYLDQTIKEIERDTTDGRVSYSIFELANKADLAPDSVGSLTLEDARDLIATMKSASSVVIELAATIHWLREKEKRADWRAELKRRKPSKADDATIDKALGLLRQLNLD
jgi:uncharacterized protein YwgA